MLMSNSTALAEVSDANEPFGLAGRSIEWRVELLTRAIDLRFQARKTWSQTDRAALLAKAACMENQAGLPRDR